MILALNRSNSILGLIILKFVSVVSSASPLTSLESLHISTSEMKRESFTVYYLKSNMKIQFI